MQLELYGGDVPCRVTAFEVADPVTGSTEVTENRTVEVTAFAASPSTGGTAVTGYLITESDVAPLPNDLQWQAGVPVQYTFEGDSNIITLYAWAKDDVGSIGGASFSIRYSNPFASPKFNDSANANVLREYDVETAANLVTSTYEFIGEGVSAGARNDTDASGSSLWTAGLDTAEDSVVVTYELPEERTVGSYMAQFGGHRPAQFVLEGFNGTDWVLLASITPAGDNNSGSFDPVAVTEIRATGTGPSSSNQYYLLKELHVYLASGQKVTLGEGYNYLHDQMPTTTGSANSDVWITPSGTAGSLMDRDFNSHVKSPWPPPAEAGTHLFLTYSFIDPLPMAAGTHGCYDGQPLGNWDIYTSDADTMPELQNIDPPGVDESVADKIIAAGWTHQHQQVSSAQSVDFAFSEPGTYKHLALVWEAAGPAMVQLELFGAAVAKWQIEGDANMDCQVNILDLIFVRNRLNQDATSADNWLADVNEDENINILDMIYVRNRLNTFCE